MFTALFLLLFRPVRGVNQGIGEIFIRTDIVRCIAFAGAYTAISGSGAKKSKGDLLAKSRKTALFLNLQSTKSATY
jgi:hypothetical protein